MLALKYGYFPKYVLLDVILSFLLTSSTMQNFYAPIQNIQNYYSIFTLLCTGYSVSDQFFVPQLSNLLVASSMQLRKRFRLADQSIKDDDKVTGFLKMGIYMFRKQADKPNCSLLRIKKAYKQNQMCREKKKKNQNFTQHHFQLVSY